MLDDNLDKCPNNTFNQHGRRNSNNMNQILWSAIRENGVIPFIYVIEVWFLVYLLGSGIMYTHITRNAGSEIIKITVGI